MRSMKVVEDPGFHRLMKTGRPQYRIPSAKTVARDVHVVFLKVKGRIASMLQVSIYFCNDYITFLPFQRSTMVG